MKVNGLTTVRAFELLISKRNWWKAAGISEIKASNYKNRFKNEQLSITKMEEILNLAGGEVVQEKLWDKRFIKYTYMVTRYTEDDMSDFVEQIISLNILEKKEEGIARFMLDNGYESLSSKQRFIFDSQVIQPFYVDCCEMCASDVPWCEMYFAYENGGYCSWCARHFD